MQSVLVPARMELIFFLVAGIVLCFGFSLRRTLITQDVLVTAEQCLHKVRAFSAPHTTPPVSRLEVHKKLGGDMARTADPS